MRKLGFSLAFLVLVTMVIPASAQNVSDEDLRVRAEVKACHEKVDANEELTYSEKTLAKRNCETEISNKYSEINNDHREVAIKHDQMQIMQKCEDWHPAFLMLDEKTWRLQKHHDQANDCLMLYKDDTWNYSGEDRVDVLIDRLLELREQQSLKPIPVAPSIQLPSQSSIIAENTRADKMTDLEDKIAELQNEIRKKDEVIKEQIKVLSDLANMLRNAVFKAFLPNGILL